MSAPNFRALPSVDRLLTLPPVQNLLAGESHAAIVDAARAVIAEARQAIAAGAPSPPPEQLAQRVVERVAARREPHLRPVINATGVIIHTNLGRAPLAPDVARLVAESAKRYSNLEFDLESGERGSRQVATRRLLGDLTGAEDALVVNNNAGAVLLTLSALCAGREVIVSRGQAVEIGGGFRVPDVLRQSGARLVEVGTTNRTYVADYASAIGPETAALLRVHPSNFRIQGFTHSASIGELAALAHDRGIVLVDDLGSGALLDTAAYGLAHEPMPQESITAGCHAVCFSADKLLGGPQAGIIVGRQAQLAAIARHPLARAVRIDKASLAGLEGTLRHYTLGSAVERIPVWQMIAMPLARIEERARNWERWLAERGIASAVVAAESAIGGGSLPGETLPTRALALDPRRVPASLIAHRLRRQSPPVVGRIERDALLLDPRTVLPDEDELLLEAVLRACS
ncbi:MAG: L-seryl-tRNA(Sec) selenium transferase [Chloroflexi bacterium]|nr:L-seryl-tRNA(Sec) selenium transferase [Chloroflexota bacterium]